MISLKEDTLWQDITPQLANNGEVEYVSRIDFVDCNYISLNDRVKIDCESFGQQPVSKSEYEILTPITEESFKGDLKEKLWWRDNKKLNITILKKYE